MSFISLAFSSDGVRPLSALAEGEHAVVVSVGSDPSAEPAAERLCALGVTHGARVTVLQTFPGIVFLCDQTELVVERALAREIFVRAEVRS